MAITTMLVVAMEAVSLLMMLVIVSSFRRVDRNQHHLILTLRGVPGSAVPHMFLIWLYVILTLLIGVGSLILFIFQPHLL